MAKKKKRVKKKQPRGLSKSNIVGYAGVPVHGTGVYDALKYTTLTCNSMKAMDREMVLAKLKTIINGPEAMNLPTATNGWDCSVLDRMGRTLLISYRGIECSLFYKRQLTEIKLLPGDTFPEGVLRDPNDAWQRLDLLGRSAKEANVVLTNLHTRLSDENEALRIRVQTLEELNGKLETTAHKAEDMMSWFTPVELRKIKVRIRKNEKKQLVLLERKKARIAKELAKKKKRKRRKT